MAMVIVLSVMDGFEAQMKKRLMGTDLHILVTPTLEADGYDAGFVSQGLISEEKIQEMKASNPDISTIWPVVATEVILKTSKKVTGVVVKGVSADRLERLKTQMTEFADSRMLVEQEDGETVRLPRLFVGQELANEMLIVPGAQVTLISPTENEGPANSVPRLKRFVVEGIYRSEVPEQELHTVFTSDGSVRSFLKRAGVVSQWEISVRDFEKAPAIAAKIKTILPSGIRIRDWIELNLHLFASLKLERIAMFVALSFIVIVASFNIVTTLTLMVLEKKKEIAILKAMGARHGQVAAIFLSEGILIGALGVGGGLILGFLTCAVLRRYEFIQLPEVYYDRTLPVTFDLRYYLGVALCATLIVLLACLYPSKRASKLNPLDGIRFG